jgi:hypothetical protein
MRHSRDGFVAWGLLFCVQTTPHQVSSTAPTAAQQLWGIPPSAAHVIFPSARALDAQCAHFRVGAGYNITRTDVEKWTEEDMQTRRAVYEWMHHCSNESYNDVAITCDPVKSHDGLIGHMRSGKNLEFDALCSSLNWTFQQFFRNEVSVDPTWFYSQFLSSHWLVVFSFFACA